MAGIVPSISITLVNTASADPLEMQTEIMGCGGRAWAVGGLKLFAVSREVSAQLVGRLDSKA